LIQEENVNKKARLAFAFRAFYYCLNMMERVCSTIKFIGV